MIHLDNKLWIFAGLLLLIAVLSAIRIEISIKRLRIEVPESSLPVDLSFQIKKMLEQEELVNSVSTPNISNS